MSPTIAAVRLKRSGTQLMKCAPTLHLICGLPGSGKSTLAKDLGRQTGAVVFAPDEWLLELGCDLYDESARARVEALQLKITRILLAKGVSVILENGFWTKSERNAYRLVADQLSAQLRLHFLDVALPELKLRIIQRNQNAIDRRSIVNPDDLDAWAACFEAPTPDEVGRS